MGSICIRKAKKEVEEVKNTHTAAKIGLRASARGKWNLDSTRLKQIGAEMVFNERGRVAPQCKGRVEVDNMSLFTIAAGERCGSLKVGFNNMKRSWVMT